MGGGKAREGESKLLVVRGQRGVRGFRVETGARAACSACIQFLGVKDPEVFHWGWELK